MLPTDFQPIRRLITLQVRQPPIISNAFANISTETDRFVLKYTRVHWCCAHGIFFWRVPTHQPPRQSAGYTSESFALLFYSKTHTCLDYVSSPILLTHTCIITGGGGTKRWTRTRFYSYRVKNQKFIVGTTPHTTAVIRDRSQTAYYQ